MNNRQAGRRRGRGGQRSQGGSPNQNNGNRIDNRARGNAAQLLEKYKNLARDAQMSGDRVNTEYYLQFADHYFRVLNENRARFEENNNNNRRQRDDQDEDEDFDFEAEGARGEEPQQREERYERQDRGDRQERQDRGDRPERGERQANGRGNGNDRGNDRAQRNGHDREPPMRADPVEAAGNGPADAAEDEAPRRRRGRPRREDAGADVAAEMPAGIDAAILPPAIGADEGEAEAKPRRRRRTRAEIEADQASQAN